MPLVSVKFSDHCHFLHFSVELLALGGNITRNICRLIVYCVGHCQCAEISLTGSVQSYFHRQPALHTLIPNKKKKGKKSVSFDSRKEANMFVFCLAQFIPGSKHFHPRTSRGSQQFYLTGTDRERQTKTIWGNTQLQCGLDLRIPKVREVLDLSAQST